MWKFARQFLSLIILITYSFTVHAEIGPGLLWRIHYPKQPASFLFGTIHVDDKRVKSLNKQVKRRFEESQTLCLEVLPDRETQVGIGLAMLLPEQQSLDDVIGDALFSELSLMLHKMGISPIESLRLKPWAAMVILSRPANDGGYALDEQLYHWGVHQYKKLCALETLQEQLQVFDELSNQDQVALLKDTMENLPILAKLNEQLISAYLTGNLDEIYRQSLKMDNMDEALSKRLRDALIDNRNARMLERMLPILKQGRAFIAVGALHLPGEKGLLNLLREKGFVVTPPDLTVSPWH